MSRSPQARRPAPRRNNVIADSAPAPADADHKQPNFVRRHGAAVGVGVGAVAVFAGIAYFFVIGDGSPPPKRIQELTIVSITPPPPPPPPPPPEVKPPEPEMIKQEPIVDPQVKEEAKTEEPKEAPPDSNDAPPPGPLGLDAAAEGPGDSFNLAGRPGGNGLLNGGGGGGSRWGYYSAMVQQQIEAALRANPKTRNSVAQVSIRVWADNTGRVTRVQIVTSSGDADVDTVIRTEVLPGLALRDPPPNDMPMPINARITLRRSG